MLHPAAGMVDAPRIAAVPYITSVGEGLVTYEYRTGRKYVCKILITSILIPIQQTIFGIKHLPRLTRSLTPRLSYIVKLAYYLQNKPQLLTFSFFIGDGEFDIALGQIFFDLPFDIAAI